jgi:spermidine synthase
LLTTQAFSSIRRVLRPGGVLSINVFGQLEDGRDWFAASIDKTLKTVFANVHIHSSGDGGLFFAASDRSPFEFLHPPDVEGIHWRANEEARTAYSNIVQTLSETWFGSNRQL